MDIHGAKKLNRATCRSCAAQVSDVILDLGEQPPSNAYLDASCAYQIDETRYPLQLVICETCGLAQLPYVVPAEKIFHKEYAYFSSFSDTWLEHAQTYCKDVIARFGLDHSSFALEIGSNDGYLLQHFAKASIPCLGVDPAAACARAAWDRARLETEVAFFDEHLATRLRATRGPADLIVANNVLAHVPDISKFVSAVAKMLAPSGVVSCEFPHLERLVAGGQFDTIYHEHYWYLSLLATEKLFQRNSLRIFDVQRIPTHGGSLRVFACHKNADFVEQASVERIRNSETAQNLVQCEGLLPLAEKAKKIRRDFSEFLDRAKALGKVTAAYGAAAKGNTFLNYCDATPRDIAFVVDRNPQKQGRLLPGTRIPVFDIDEIARRRPDYLLILPWNLVDEIEQSHSYIRDWSGQFVVTQPELRIR